MPLYEYECQQCHKRVEKIQKFSDAPLSTCPHCSGALERTLTAPAVQFKGSGWYKDLYSSAKPAAPPGNGAGDGGSAAPSGDKGASSGGGGGEKPAATPAAPSAAPAPASSSSSSSGGTGS